MTKSIFTPEYDLLRARLVEMRTSAGLTQRQLAAKLGRERSFVARVEQGERRVDLVEFAWICRACGVSAEKITRDLLRGFRRVGRSSQSLPRSTT